mgnify:CR=1 FL=1
MPRRGSSKPPAEPVVKPYGCDFYLGNFSKYNKEHPLFIINRVTYFIVLTALFIMSMETLPFKE